MKRKARKKKRAPALVPHMSDDDLRKFVLAWCDGYVTSTDRLDPKMIPLVFLPVALGAFADWTKRQLATIGLIYAIAGEDTDCKRSVNGYRIFASCRLMHIDDWARARVAINVELDRRKTIKV